MKTNEIFTVKGIEFKFIKASAKNQGKKHIWALNMETKKQTQVCLEDIDSDIESLAYKMDVEPREVEMFAQSICNSIQQDKADSFFTNEASENEQKEMTVAYAQHAVKKLQEFQTSYMTNKNMRSLFNDMVFAQLKYNWKPAI
mgnify:CR=1 FL=1